MTLTSRTHKLTTSKGTRFRFQEINWNADTVETIEALSDDLAETLSGFLAAHADFLYILDREFRFVYANRALLRLWNRSLSDVRGKNFADLDYPGDLVELHEAQLIIAFSGKTIRGENSYTGADGKERYYEYIFTPLPPRAKGDKIRTIAGITRDISHRKQMEMERERLLSAIAHDLRTPLSVIASAAEFIEGGDNSDMVQLIRINAVRSVNLIEDLLDSLSFQAGKRLKMHFENVDLSVLCKEIVQEFNILKEGSTSIETAFSGEDHAVKADPNAIRRIVTNLVSNAVKYGNAKRGIRLELERTRDRICLSVRNWGSVLDDEELAQIFDLFRQGEFKTANADRGWGIGLSIVSLLTKAHGGSIEVTSDKEEGTVFTINLPAHPLDSGDQSVK